MEDRYLVVQDYIQVRRRGIYPGSLLCLSVRGWKQKVRIWELVFRSMDTSQVSLFFSFLFFFPFVSHGVLVTSWSGHSSSVGLVHRSVGRVMVMVGLG